MMLEVRDIRKSFDGVKALDGASLSVKQGTISSLFGANGSGKSTLFNIIGGYLKADGGDILLQARAITRQAPLTIARMGIGRMWQSPRVFKDLSVMENMMMADRSSGARGPLSLIGTGNSKRKSDTHRKVAQLLDEVGMAERVDDMAGALSLGQQKLLSISMLRMNDPDVLLLDEPFAGVAPAMVQHIASVLVKLKEQGHTILLIEHNTAISQSISDQVLEMRSGRIATLKPLAL